MKVAIITGASSGIGKEIALTLAKEQYNIVINYRKENEELEKIKKEIEDNNVKCLMIKTDVSKFGECEKLVKEVIEKFGEISLLVNNAGITKDNLILRMTEEEFDDVIKVNLKGTFNMTRNVIPFMSKKKAGKIINLSSVVGISGNAGQANYAASKAGVIGFTKSVAKEFASRNIMVNAIAPGYIKTKMTDILSDEIKNNIAKNIPLKRLGEPKDIANLVKFLASDECLYITGQVIHVDGGMLI
ncbi:MAG: 3-oxoacyl-[acyl-carrier-protein] reductase [Mollicutes bacterium]|nr:3-oxoacyl-[acyl-carrier-protein] reductase [Mollicutes bacterium]